MDVMESLRLGTVADRLQHRYVSRRVDVIRIHSRHVYSNHSYVHWVWNRDYLTDRFYYSNNLLKPVFFLN